MSSTRQESEVLGRASQSYGGGEGVGGGVSEGPLEAIQTWGPQKLRVASKDMCKSQKPSGWF